MPSFNRRKLLKFFFPSLFTVTSLDAISNKSTMIENEGYKSKKNEIFHVTTIDDLRSMEPVENGQVVCLSINNSDGQVINKDFLVFDQNDNSSIDDGFLVFVTKRKNRWKRSLSCGINLQWFGLQNYGDLSRPWMAAIECILELFIRKDNRAIPSILITAGEYTVTETIFVPPFISTIFSGKVILRVTSDFSGDNSVIWVKGLPASRPYTDGRVYTLSGVGGELHIKGDKRKGLTGLKIGNTNNNNFFADKTGECPCCISNVSITGFDKGIGFTGYDCYLVHFESVMSALNNTNITTLDTISINSGERISFSNCNFWGGGRGDGHLYIDTNQFDLQFNNCSFDYTSSDFIKLGRNSGWSACKFVQCHFEGVEKYIVNAAAPKIPPVNITFSACIFLPTGRYNSNISNSPSRKLFLLGKGCTCDINGLDLRVTEYPLDGNILMCESDRLVVKSLTRVIYPVIPSLAHVKNKNIGFSNEINGSILDKEHSLRFFYCLDNQNVNGIVTKEDEHDFILSLKVSDLTLRGHITIGFKEYFSICSRQIYTSTLSIRFPQLQNIIIVHIMSWFDASFHLIATNKYEYKFDGCMEKIKKSEMSYQFPITIPTISKYWSPPKEAIYLKAGATILNLRSDIAIESFIIGEI